MQTTLTSHDQPLPHQDITPNSQLTPQNNNMPPEIPTDPQQPPTQHQITLNAPITNNGWGDIVKYKCPQGLFRVISKNISQSTKLCTMDASIFLAQETNIVWNPDTMQQIDTQCRQVFQHHKMVMSSSQDSNTANYQPGGTMTLETGRWANWVTNWGHNAVLGQWSYIELAGHNKK